MLGFNLGMRPTTPRAVILENCVDRIFCPPRREKKAIHSFSRYLFSASSVGDTLANKKEMAFFSHEVFNGVVGQTDRQTPEHQVNIK